MKNTSRILMDSMVVFKKGRVIGFFFQIIAIGF